MALVSASNARPDSVPSRSACDSSFKRILLSRYWAERRLYDPSCDVFICVISLSIWADSFLAAVASANACLAFHWAVVTSRYSATNLSDCSVTNWMERRCSSVAPDTPCILFTRSPAALCNLALLASYFAFSSSNCPINLVIESSGAIRSEYRIGFGLSITVIFV